jgi:hypothetical protein
MSIKKTYLRHMFVVELFDGNECVKSWACDSREPQHCRLIQSAALAWRRA